MIYKFKHLMVSILIHHEAFCSLVESEGKHIRSQMDIVVNLQEDLEFVDITKALPPFQAMCKKVWGTRGAVTESPYVCKKRLSSSADKRHCYENLPRQEATQ